MARPLTIEDRVSDSLDLQCKWQAICWVILGFLIPKLVEPPLGNQVLLHKEGVHDLAISANRPFLRIQGVPLQRAVSHRLSHRMARRLENGVGISVDVDELRLGKDAEEETDSP